MVFCYGVFIKLLNLCKPSKRNPSQKELQNKILSSVYEPYINAGISDYVSTDLAKCKQGLSNEIVNAARIIIDSGETKKIAVYFNKKIIECNMIKNDETTVNLLVSALLDIICNDNLISDNTIVEKVSGSTKKEILTKKEFILPDFLAGLFLYTIVAIDNRKGKDTCLLINDNYINKFGEKKLKIIRDYHVLTEKVQSQDLINPIIKKGENIHQNSKGVFNKQDISESDFELKINETIIKCNTILHRTQNKVRVYSWDELDFNAIYVPPFFSNRPRFDYDTNHHNGSKNNDKSKLHIEEESFSTLTDFILDLDEKYINNILDLDEKYINNILELDEKYILERGDYRKQKRSLSERNKIINDLFLYDNIVYVIGGAGYGKSLFLKNLAVNPYLLKDFDKNPLLVIRGDIKRLIHSDGTFKSMTEFIEECFINSSLKRSDEFYPNFLETCLKTGKCLILLDALDEVGNDQRYELHQLIISYFKDIYPNNKVCITSRERGFIPCKDIKCFYIAPIVMNEVEEYVDKFIELGKFNADEKQRFLDQTLVLVQKNFVKGFLTLSLLLAIYKNEQELPANKLLLYEKCFEYIANTREKNKKLLLNSGTGKEYDWNILAKLMNDATFMELAQLGTPNNSDIEKDKIYDLMIALYEKRFYNRTECRIATEIFLQFCSDRTEIFVPSLNSNREYRFFHRSFYEYFYAKFIEARTNDVKETYKKIYNFDVDSEIFELLLTLYGQRNPCYLRNLILYAFVKAESSIRGSKEDFEKCISILVMMMQVVDEKDLIARFITLCMENGEIISSCSSILEFDLFNDPIKRNISFFIEKFNENSMFYLSKIRAELIKFFLENSIYCKNILKNVVIKDTEPQKGFAYSRFMILLPDCYELMEKIFDKFAHKRYLLYVEKLDGKSVNDLLVFVSKVNLLPLKKRIQVYNAILAKI